jgi:hypothetical protein
MDLKNDIMATSVITHKEEHLRGSEIITDIVVGMSYRLTVPFALAFNNLS